MIPKNKRGDIPVMVLVMGIIAVCMFAILTFYMSDRNTKNAFEIIDTVKAASLIDDKIIFYENAGYGTTEVIKILNLNVDGNKKYYSVSEDKITVRYDLP